MPFHTVLRLIFVYQFYRYYQGRTSKKRTLILGILVESELLIIPALNALYILLVPPYLTVIIGIPTPFLLLISLAAMELYQPQKKESGWLSEER